MLGKLKKMIQQKFYGLLKGSIGLLEKPGDLIRNIRIQKRLMISFIILSFIPLLFMGIFSYIKSSNAIKSKISRYSIQIVDQVKMNIRDRTVKYEYLCDQIMMSKQIQNELLNYSNQDDMSKVRITKEINRFLGEKSSLLVNIKDIQINSQDGGLFYDLGYETINQDDVERLTIEASLKRGGFVWSYASTNKDSDIIVLCKQLNSSNDSSIKIGYVFVAIDEKHISNIFSNIDMGRGSDLFVLDKNGIVVSSVNTFIKENSPFPDISLMENIHKHEKTGIWYFPQVIHQEAYLVAYTYDDYTEWYTVSTIPFSYLEEEPKIIEKSILLLGLFCLAISFMASLFISQSISGPLGKLMHLMSQVQDDNLNVNMDDHCRDEVAYLSGHFNRMIGRIRSLLEQIRVEQVRKREMEFQVLQAQINPHFLFNTLNSLKWTAMMSQANNVGEGLEALAELLKNTIIDKNELVSIQSEIKNIENYITIQKIRYGNGFSVIYDIDEELMGCRILKFLLQPIVENSIIHGFDEESDEKTLNISCKKVDSGIEICIRDNGQGIDNETLKGLLNKPGFTKNRLSNIGIPNVQERIKLHFGDKYGLEIRSRVGHGTDVIVRIPLISQEN